MALYTDDYSIVDTAFIAHAVPINPCPEHGEPDWLIGLLLAIGDRGYQVAQCYPTRALRDLAFERIVARMQREAAQVEE